MNIFDPNYIENLKQEILNEIMDIDYNVKLNSVSKLNKDNNINPLEAVICGILASATPGSLIGSYYTGKSIIVNKLINSYLNENLKKQEIAQNELKEQLQHQINEFQHDLNIKIESEHRHQIRKLEESLDAHLSLISSQINDIKQLLNTLAYSSDMIINSMGSANQRTTREIIETQNLVKEYMELVKSTEPDRDNKLKKFINDLPKEVFISLIGDVIKSFLKMP